MARTSTPKTALTKGAATAQPTGVAVDPTNGHVLAAPTTAGTVILDIDSTFAGVKTYGFPAGAALGDLVISLNAQRALTPIDSHRFTQPDGTILVDAQAGATGTVRAYVLPY